MPGNDLGSRRRRDRGKRAVGIVVTKPNNRQNVNYQWHPRPRLPRLELSEYSDPSLFIQFSALKKVKSSNCDFNRLLLMCPFIN